MTTRKTVCIDRNHPLCCAPHGGILAARADVHDRDAVGAGNQPRRQLHIASQAADTETAIEVPVMESEHRTACMLLCEAEQADSAEGNYGHHLRLNEPGIDPV
jgi:hypothetical protein